jgi:hypothetical protein
VAGTGSSTTSATIRTVTGRMIMMTPDVVSATSVRRTFGSAGCVALRGASLLVMSSTVSSRASSANRQAQCRAHRASHEVETP